jgi:predicted RNase H-like nuclease (RuvC/YqgF family)
MMPRAALALLALVVFALGSPAIAATSADEKLLEEMTTRLKLTEAQQAQIAPPLEQRNKQLKSLRGDLSENASRRQKLKALRQARSIQQEFVGKVSAVLTKDQKAEWEKMREEMRDKASELRQSR